MEAEQFETTVRQCARCGGDHRMSFREFGEPIGPWKHWGLCPTTGEPVILSVQHTGQDVLDLIRKQSAPGVWRAIEALTEALFTDGAHHKQWYVDRALREVLGAKYSAYREAVCHVQKINPGDWDEGIIP